MSRSYKKIPVWKQPNDFYFKSLVHKRNRMLERLRIFLSPRQYLYCVNPYDICDWCWPIFGQEPHPLWPTEADIRKARMK